MYNAHGNTIFNLDDSGDQEYFNKAVKYIKACSKIEVKEYQPGGWGTSYLIFYHKGIRFELYYSDFGGTEMHIPDKDFLKSSIMIKDFLSKLKTVINA